MHAYSMDLRCTPYMPLIYGTCYLSIVQAIDLWYMLMLDLTFTGLLDLLCLSDYPVYLTLSLTRWSVDFLCLLDSLAYVSHWSAWPSLSAIPLRLLDPLCLLDYNCLFYLSSIWLTLSARLSGRLTSSVWLTHLPIFLTSLLDVVCLTTSSAWFTLFTSLLPLDLSSIWLTLSALFGVRLTSSIYLALYFHAIFIWCMLCMLSIMHVAIYDA